MTANDPPAPLRMAGLLLGVLVAFTSHPATGGGSPEPAETEADGPKPAWVLDDPTPSGGDRFGQALAAGERFLAIAAPGHNGEVRGAGEVHVFDRHTGRLLHTLSDPTPTRSGQFGFALALDGGRLAVGAPGDKASGPDTGEVHVFDAASGALLLSLANPAAASLGRFGASVALQGERLLVGAPGDSTVMPRSGRAYVFECCVPAEDGSHRRPATILSDPTPARDDMFGISVALAGNTAIVGVPRDGSRVASRPGQVLLFDLSTGEAIRSIDDPTPTRFDGFGSGLTVHDHRLAVGAPADDSHRRADGQAHLLSLRDDAFQRTLDDPDRTGGDRFGTRLHLACGHLAVSAPFHDGHARDVGQVVLFDWDGAEILHNLVPPELRELDGFGTDVAIAPGMLIVSAPGRDRDLDGDGEYGAGELDFGRVYGFELASTGDCEAK